MLARGLTVLATAFFACVHGINQGVRSDGHVRISEHVFNEQVGCCYKIGYGAMMKPCCLSTQNKSASDCKVNGGLVGGAVGWSESCPATADEAHERIEAAGSKTPSMIDNNRTAPVAQSSAAGPGCAVIAFLFCVCTWVT
eukprot:gnl/TRDRNA2_/TRDRNA2_35805_c0_seq1.p1 gnl/TRDRNA2_/TRDRNA2_35805_c0~~gnl/TRDRNA2_/TRDRNA2_35805_c0_seq1.p1  ORF type:complete len:140 (+),score=27.24 gnl/TRDRNA2_/TRDRNA2_35805_c0_seq1:64-483(+)